jgi:ribosomal protein S18 acetylase RimI-like enzyme
MNKINISLMEHSDVLKAAEVLSYAMLNNPLHIAVFQGNGERERLEIEKMFIELFNKMPGIVYLAKEGEEIIGVMRMKSCVGRKAADNLNELQGENDIGWRKSIWHSEWARHDPLNQHWHLGPIGVLPSHQGSGVGSLLMARFCNEVDACLSEAYLETDLDENVRFYKKFGFEVISISNIFRVENRYMLRGSRT